MGDVSSREYDGGVSGNEVGEGAMMGLTVWGRCLVPAPGYLERKAMTLSDPGGADSRKGG